MNTRISDLTYSSEFASRINTQRNRLSLFQERISTGKRINRASDDPIGTGAVIKLRTSQKEIQQFQRSAQAADQKLVAADDALSGYEKILERVKTLTSQGLSDTAPQQTRDYLANEIDALRTRILGIANYKNDEEYLFGGTRQNAPPFDPVTATPAATPSTAQFVQIEPGANAIAVGVTAESFFSDATSDIFTDLTNAVAALRGTGNAATDRTTLETTMTRLNNYTSLSSMAQATVGINMNGAETAADNLGNTFLNYDGRAAQIEDADFAESAVGLTTAQQSLDATLQVAAKGRRSLFDFLG